MIYLINFSAEKVTRTKIELAKAGPLGNGAAVQFTKNGTTTNYYGEELKSAAEFTKHYEGNGGLVTYFVKDANGNNTGNLTGGYGHELSAEEQKTYPEGTSIPQTVADDWLSSDWKSKGQLVQNNLTVSDLSSTETEALTDFAYNIRKAPSRIASFTKESGANFFLGFMGDVSKYPGLGKRRIGESVLFGEGKYFGFESLNKKQGNTLNNLIQQNTPAPANNGGDSNCEEECH